MADKSLAFERTMQVPSNDERALAVVFYLGWMLGLWPELVGIVIWWLRGKPRFAIAHAAQSHVFGGILGPLLLIGVLVQTACGLGATITGNVRGFLVPGLLAFAAGGGAWLGLVLLQCAAGTIQAVRGRIWADPLTRAFARSVRSAEGAGAAIDETERLLAAASYFSFCVALVSLLRAPKTAKHLRFHATQGLVVSFAWGWLIFALLFAAAAWIPQRPDNHLEYGAAIATMASVPIVAFCFALAIACFRGGRRAALGLPYRLPLASALADRVA